MLPKRHRADRKILERVFSSGKFVATGGISLKFLIDLPEKSPKNGPKICFVAPKSSVKKATERNALRRTGYVEMEKRLSFLPRGFCGAFVIKNPKIDLKKEIDAILRKIKTEKHEKNSD